QVTQQLINDYWVYVLSQTGLKSPMINEVCQNQVPELVDQRLILNVDNEIVKSFVEKQALGPIQESFERVGFPVMNFKIELDDSNVQEKIDDLKAKQAKRDQEIAKKAATVIAEKKQQQQAQASQGDAPTEAVLG